MAKTWVLDTETKGTGAHIAPLREGGEQRAEPALNLTRFKVPPRPQPEPAQPPVRTFKVVDVLGARTLAADVPLAAAAAELARLRSPLDARVYVRAGDGERWRLLTLAETRALWGQARRAERERSAPTQAAD